MAKNLSNVSVPVNAHIPSAIDIGFVDEFDGRAEGDSRSGALTAWDNAPTIQ